MEANILRILVILIGVALVAVILIQQPKEGGMGAFTGGGGGSGASSTVFGAKGSGSFLFRLTAGLVLAFTIMIVALVKVTNSNVGGSVLSAPVATESENTIPGAATDNATNKVATENHSESNATNTTASEETIPGSVENTPIDNSIPGAASTTETSAPIE